MTNPAHPRLGSLGALLAGALAIPLLAAGPLPVSPGDAERTVEATSACPTFSWTGVDGAVAYELALLDLSDRENPDLVATQRIEGAGFSWTPARDRCLAPGRAYAWLVRAEVAGQGLGEWSAPRHFRVPGEPTAEEVDAALALLARWRAAQPPGSAPAGAGERGPVAGRSPSRGAEPAAAEPEAPLATGVAAIRGEIPDTTGSAYGVLGITSSPQGAGVVARNQSAGADLVLDGEAQGEPDTLLTQNGIQRLVGTGALTFFNIEAPGPGVMVLQVDGFEVDTANTPIPWSRLIGVPAGFTDGVDNDTLYSAGNQLQLAGTTFNVLEGPGSGLDADTLDGAQRSTLQTRVSGSCPPTQSIRGINSDGSVVCEQLSALPRITIVHDVADIVGWSSSIAIGTDGFPVLAYLNLSSSSLIFAKCHDPACEESTRYAIDGPPAISGVSAPSVTIDPSGRAVIAYVADGNLKVARCNDTNCASRSVYTVDNPIHIVSQPSIAIGNDGLPVIAYRDSDAESLKVAKCNDAACAPLGEVITTVYDPDNRLGESVDLAIGGDGLPVISLHDETEYQLLLVRCNDAACAPGGEAVVVVDGDFGSGFGNAIAISPDGFPVISYGGPDHSIRVAKCLNADCSVGTKTTIDDLEDDLLETDIAIGADGWPVIVYFNWTRNAVKVAKCNEETCSGGDVIRTVIERSTVDVWRGLALAIGADGFPVISYVDGEIDGLKVAKCNTRSCFAP